MVKSMLQHVISFFMKANYFALLSFVVLSANLHAEGIFHMGLNQPLKPETVLYVHVNDANQWIKIYLCEEGNSEEEVSVSIHSTSLHGDKYQLDNELITLTSSQANIDCSHAMDAELAAADAMAYQVTSSGIYAIRFKDSKNKKYTRWDISVVDNEADAVDPMRADGNLFSYQWSFSAPSFDLSAAVTTQLFVLVPGGFPNTNYVWALDLQEYSGYEYDILANNIGLDAPFSGLSRPAEGASISEKYPVYLSYPNGANPAPAPEQNPSLFSDFIFVDDAGNESVFSPDGDSIADSGSFQFTSDVSGTYALTIDINRDGEFGAKDKLLLGTMTENTLTSVAWDGTDAAGNLVPNATYNVLLQMRLGEYHFVAKDVETSGGGTNNDGTGEPDGLTVFQAIDSQTLRDTIVYWDDETLLGGQSNLPRGVMSSPSLTGPHRHTWGNFTESSIGDSAYIDTYVYGRASQHTTRLLIAARNDPPIIEEIVFSISEGAALGSSIGVPVSNDVNGDVLAYGFVSGNDDNLFAINEITGEISLVSALDFETNEIYRLIVEVSDQAQTDTAEITIDINNEYEIPLAVNDIASTSEDTDLNIALLGNDFIDGTGTAMIDSVDAENGSVVINPDNSITYTPNVNFNGVDTLDYQVSDGLGGNSTAKVEVIVTGVNDVPVATLDDRVTNENTGTTINVLDNDVDVDGDTLRVTEANVDNPEFGTVTINDDQSLTFMPAENFDGEASITYSITDDNGGSASASVTVTVVNVNQIPFANEDSASVDENGSVTIEVLSNDSDPDGGNLSITEATVDNPEHGAVVINDDQSISFTPAEDFDGTTSLTYTIEDDNGGEEGNGTASGVVNVTVNNVNKVPVANEDTISVDENGSVVIDVLSNDSDPDGGNLSIAEAKVDNPEHGVVVINDDQSISFTPAKDFDGTTSLTYTIEDDNGGEEGNGTASGVVNVTVNNVNKVPMANEDAISVNENGSVVIDALSNDSDPDGGNLSITEANVDPENGVVVNDGQTLTFTPAKDFDGTTRITYTIADDNGGEEGNGTVSGVVTVTVINVNKVPVANEDTISVDENGSVVIDVLSNDSDPDGGNLSITEAKVDNPEHGVLVNDDGMLTFTPAKDFDGATRITYTIADDNGGDEGHGTASGVVNVTVNNVNKVPVANEDKVTLVKNASVTINVLHNDSDPDGENLRVIEATAEHGSVLINPDQTLTYTAQADFTGDDNIIYRIDDGSGGSAQSSVLITVFAELVLSGIPATSVVENKAYQFTPTVTGGNNETLLFTIQNVPAWLNFNSTTGTLTGTPTGADVKTYNGISLCVAEPQRCLPAFNISVLTDMDNDGISDIDDNDIDGDGMDNKYEEDNGLDPKDAADRDQDMDGDGVSNWDEHVNGSHPGKDDNPPELILPEDITVNAVGLFTVVDIGQATATDYANGVQEDCCQPVIIPSVMEGDLFEPGTTEIIWQAKDVVGNETTGSQLIHVAPLVSFSKDQSVSEGQQATVRILLNGVSPIYPLEIPYTVGTEAGTASTDDHDWLSGSVIFENATETEKSINFTITEDNLTEGDEFFQATLSDTVNRGGKRTINIFIVENDLAQSVELKVTQQDKTTLNVIRTGGAVTVIPQITQARLEAIFSYDWSQTDGSLLGGTDATNDALTFNPLELEVGTYQVELVVTDNNDSSLSSTTGAQIVVRDDDGNHPLQMDSDQNGIADKPDDIAPCNVIPGQAAEADGFLLESEPSSCLRLGRFALTGETSGAQISVADFNNNTDLVEDSVANIGGYYDTLAYRLPDMGQDIRIVIPQRTALPENAIYRLYTVEQSWYDFDETGAKNHVFSAPGTPGYCPPPLDETYVEGLRAGDWCVQILIADGGVNDADQTENRMVEIFGGVGHRDPVPDVIVTVEPALSMDAETKGGGANQFFFIFFMFMLLTVYRISIKADSVIRRLR